MPATTPVWLPRNESGSMPACSSASHAVSSSSRCWGLMASASRGLTPKNAASKPATSARKPPRPEPVESRPNRSDNTAQPRSAGYGPVASTPPATSRHSSSGPCAVGYRQPMPTTTTGSGCLVCSSRSCSRVRCNSAVTRLRYSRILSSVIWVSPLSHAEVVDEGEHVRRGRRLELVLDGGDVLGARGGGPRLVVQLAHQHLQAGGDPGALDLVCRQAGDDPLQCVQCGQDGVGGRAAGEPEAGTQERGQLGRVRVVEHHGGRQAHPGGRDQPVAQLDRG